jgi:hypothetical protein
LAGIRPRRLGPAETAETENEKDRNCRENEGIGENGRGLKKLKHRKAPPKAFVSMLKRKHIQRSNLFKIAQVGKIDVGRQRGAALGLTDGE